MQTINQLHCILKQYAGYFFFLYSGSLTKYFVSVLILWLSCSRWIFTLGEQGKNRYLTSPFIISDFEYIFAGELHLILTDFFFSNFPYYDQDFFYLDNLENNNINSCPHFYFFFKSVSVCEIKRDVSILKAPMDPKQIIIFVLHPKIFLWLYFCITVKRLYHLRNNITRKDFSLSLPIMFC